MKNFQIQIPTFPVFYQILFVNLTLFFQLFHFSFQIIMSHYALIMYLNCYKRFDDGLVLFDDRLFATSYNYVSCVITLDECCVFGFADPYFKFFTEFFYSKLDLNLASTFLLYVICIRTL